MLISTFLSSLRVKSLFRNRKHQIGCPSPSRQTRRRTPLCLEPLEDRTVPSHLVIMSGGGAASGTNTTLGTSDSFSVGPNASNQLGVAGFGGVGASTWVLADLAPEGNSAGVIEASVGWSGEYSASANVNATFQIVPDAGDQLGDPVLLEYGAEDDSEQLGGTLSKFSFSVSGANGLPYQYVHIGDSFSVDAQATIDTLGLMTSRVNAGGIVYIELYPVAVTTLVTQANPTTVTLGASTPTTLADEAVLSGGRHPTGTIAFTLTGPTGPVDTETAPVSGDGTYATPTGYNLPTSGNVAGTYTWSASYSGDQNNSSTNDQGGSAEQTVVSPAGPTLVTTASPAITLDGSGAPTLTDTAVLSGGFNETGSITFTLSGPGGFSYTQIDPVSSDGTYNAATTLPASGTVSGTYTWSASYSGDPNNNAANDQGGTAEQTVVSPASPTLATTASPAIPLDGTGAPTLTDTAVLSGGYSETGSITFTLSGPGGLSYTQIDPVSSDGTYNAATTLPTTGQVAGAYTWSAKYSGDSNNNSANDQGGSAEQSVVNPASPTLVTTASTAFALGSSGPPTLTDTAVLSGGYSETGSITFTLSGPGGFSYSQIDAVSSDVTYNAATTLPALGTVAGTYTWSASYSGDSNNNAANDQGGSAEQIVVSPASPKLVTTASPAMTLDGSGAPPLTDSAVLSGGYSETGIITFTLAAPNGSTVDTESIAVNGDGDYNTPTGYTLPSSGAQVGTYAWSAIYSGDPNNNAANDQGGSAEQTVVTSVSGANPTLMTAASPATFTLNSGPNPPLKDTAVLSGGSHPTGKITFILSGPSGPLDTETVTVHGDGTYATPTGYKLATSGTVAGTYTWSASYGGDPYNQSANDQGGSAEQTVVHQASPTLVTTASPAITLGTTAPTITDSAVLSGGNHETGNLVFTLTGPGFTYTQTDTVSRNGTYKASTKLPTTGTVAGTYTWTAGYSGDANNLSANDQGGAAEQTVVNKATPKIVTTAKPSGTVLAGTTAPTLSDSAVLSGGYYETGTLTFTLHQGTFTGTAVYTTTVTVGGNHTYAVSTASEAATGLYSWTVSYSGDMNDNSTQDQQNAAEQVTVLDKVVKTEAATMPFWASTNGQALLQTYGAALGNWLGGTSGWTNLFGNLNGATGAQIAAYLLAVKKNSSGLDGKLYTQALTTALNVWATTTGLGWNTSSTGPTTYGFQQGFGGLGLGSIYDNVGSNGASFGTSNNTILTVNYLLGYLSSNTVQTGGNYIAVPALVFYGGNTTLENAADSVFNHINQLGGIA